MSFIFSRALVEASLQVNCVEIDAYAPLNLIPTPKRSSLRAKTMAPFRLSRFGMTFEPLTDSDGEELLTSWLEGFPVKTSVQLAQAMDSTASEADFGRKWRGSFTKFDPSESKWKTAQCSLLGDSDEYLETWPRWGSMWNGESFLRPIPALPICENASGFWQTPVADDAVERTKGKWNSRGEPKLSAEVKLWPTPCASASKGSSPAALMRKSGKDRSNDRIDHAVMASDGGQLNPEWVEWLMGWPIGHTALEPLETAKYHEWLAQHSPYSQTNEEPT